MNEAKRKILDWCIKDSTLATSGVYAGRLLVNVPEIKEDIMVIMGEDVSQFDEILTELYNDGYIEKMPIYKNWAIIGDPVQFARARQRELDEQVRQNSIAGVD